jgi:hypothetical protein
VFVEVLTWLSLVLQDLGKEKVKSGSTSILQKHPIMSTSDVLSFIAIVIASISIFLQRKDAGKQLLVANFSAYTKRYQELLEKFPACIVDKSFNMSKLSKEQREVVLRYMWIYFELCYEEFFLYKQKFIPQDVWKAWKAGMASSFSRPSFQQSWQLIKNYNHFPSDFTNFIDSFVYKNLKLLLH